MTNNSSLKQQNTQQRKWADLLTIAIIVIGYLISPALTFAANQQPSLPMTTLPSILTHLKALIDPRSAMPRNAGGM